MTDTNEVEHVEAYSTEAKANIRARVMRMRALIKHIEHNGFHVTKKKLLALYCLKEGISKSTAYGYLEEYMEAEIVVQYGENIMTMEQYIAKKSGDTERIKELAGGEEVTSLIGQIKEDR
jgi:hypothetical protein